MIIGGKEKYAGAGLVLSFANQQLSSCDDRRSALTFNIFLRTYYQREPKNGTVWSSLMDHHQCGYVEMLVNGTSILGLQGR